MNIYRTSDLGIATALHSLGASLISVDKTYPSRAVFELETNYDFSSIESDYWSDQLFVSAQSYMASMKQLKARLYG